MPLLLGLLLSAYNFRLLTKDEARGIVLYCVLMVCCPSFQVGGFSLNYSYVFLPFLLLWHIVYAKSNYKVSAALLPLWGVFFLSLFASFLSLNIYGVHGEFVYSPVVGTVKSLLIVFVLSKCSALKDKFTLILSWILWLNVIASALEYLLIQMFGPAWVLTTWMGLFGNMGNTLGLESGLELDYIGRLHGTFTSPSLLGSLSMLGIGYFLIRYFTDRSWYSVLMLICSLFIGLCASSKRFFLGGVAVCIISLIIRVLWIRVKKKDYKLVLVVILVSCFMVAVYGFLSDVLALDYYLKFLTEGKVSQSLETRFSDEGAVNAMRSVIAEYWMTGVGEISIYNINVTDSEFYCTLYKAGIVGALLYLLLFFRLSVRTVLLKNSSVAIVLFIIMFEFIISTEFYTSFGLLLISYVISALYQKNTSKSILS